MICYTLGSFHQRNKGTFYAGIALGGLQESAFAAEQGGAGGVDDCVGGVVSADAAGEVVHVVAGVFVFAQMYSNYGGENATIFFKYGRGL